ncbi:rhodanese-like domain-containing protein [Qipengyuania algicida]|nr:rhodanese-like domain-containing protein [Qipengyuania algicida]
MDEVNMFGFGQKAPMNELSPGELEQLMAGDKAVVVDVREPGEFASGHITGAINRPLSSFDPSALPRAPGKTVVLVCAGGKRSAMALNKCAKAEAAIDTHLNGGMAAWACANLPVQR